MSCGKEKPCDLKKFTGRSFPCCAFVNDELSSFVCSSTSIFMETLAQLNKFEVVDQTCRRNTLSDAYSQIYGKVLESYQTVLASGCVKYCCDAVALAISGLALSFFRLIVTAILDKSIECTGELPPLQAFVDRQLGHLSDGLSVVLSTIECPCKHDETTPCFEAKTEVYSDLEEPGVESELELEKPCHRCHHKEKDEPKECDEPGDSDGESENSGCERGGFVRKFEDGVTTTKYADGAVHKFYRFH